MCAAMIFVNYKLFHSSTWQGYLMYDYNSHTFNLPFDLAVKINNKFLFSSKFAQNLDNLYLKNY